MTTARDPFAPRFQVYIDNELIPLEIAQFIESVSVEDDAEIFDKIRLNIQALQFTKKGNVKDIIDSKMFNPPNLLRVDMGYGNSMKTVGVGEIVKVTPRFGRDGITMEVIAYDPFHRLAKKKHFAARPFNKKISEIFRSVIEAYPIAIFVEDINDKNKDIVKEITQTVGKTDYQFLKSLANSKGLDFFNEFDPKIGKFKFILSEPNDTSDPKFTFTYFEHDDEPLKTLYEFNPQMNSVDQVTDVQFRNFNRKTKQKIQTFVTNIDPTTGQQNTKFKGPDKTKNFKAQSGSNLTFTSFGQHFELITTIPFQNPKEAKIFAEACLKQRLDDFITGNGVLIGVESLKARIVVELKGLSEAFDGNYYLNRVVHNQADGQPYLTNIECRKIVKLVV